MKIIKLLVCIFVLLMIALNAICAGKNESILNKSVVRLKKLLINNKFYNPTLYDVESITNRELGVCQAK